MKIKITTGLVVLRNFMRARVMCWMHFVVVLIDSTRGMFSLLRGWVRETVDGRLGGWVRGCVSMVVAVS